MTWYGSNSMNGFPLRYKQHFPASGLSIPSEIYTHTTYWLKKSISMICAYCNNYIVFHLTRSLIIIYLGTEKIKENIN